MNPLSIIRDVVRALQGGADPRFAAAGFAMGAALGLVPKNSLWTIILVLFFLLFRVDKGMAVLGAALFTPLAYALDGVAHRLGLAVLTAQPLAGLWTRLYDLPIVPLTRFNNTVVMGNLLLSALLFWPLYLLAMRGVVSYRARWSERVARLRLVKAFTGLRLVNLYLQWTKEA